MNYWLGRWLHRKTWEMIFLLFRSPGRFLARRGLNIKQFPRELNYDSGASRARAGAPSDARWNCCEVYPDAIREMLDATRIEHTLISRITLAYVSKSRRVRYNTDTLYAFRDRLIDELLSWDPRGRLEFSDATPNCTLRRPWRYSRYRLRRFTQLSQDIRVAQLSQLSPPPPSLLLRLVVRIYKRGVQRESSNE